MMKRIIAILMAVVLCITLIACSKQSSTQTEDLSSETTSSEQVYVTSSKTDNSDDTTTTHSEKTTESSIPSLEKETTQKTQSTEEKTVESEVKPPISTKNTTESTTSTKTDTVKTTKKDEETKQEAPVTEATEPVKETEQIKIATPSADEVEKKVIEYINQYRTAQGQSQVVVLTGLNGVAKYRAKQLVSSYEHVHPRTTCGELKYGMYVDLTAYGLPESDNYYEGFDKEALCKGDWYGTADQIAQTIATGFKNSSVHWSYVGQSKYQYMGVGIYYDEVTEMWYGCICMSKENYGG